MSRRALLAVVLLAASCGPQDAGTAKKPLLDRSKPLLTDAKIAGLLNVAKDRPDLRRAFPSKDAPKYGFADYDEFAEVRTRLYTAQASVQGAETLDPRIKDTEAKLAQPGLSEGARKMHHDNLASMQRTRNGYLKQLHPDDLDAYRRHRAAVDAVLK